MKRVLLAIFLLAVGAVVFGTLRHATAAIRRDISIQSAASAQQSAGLIRLRSEQQQLSDHVQQTGQLLSSQPSVPALGRLAQKILSGASLQNLTAAETEQLLAELGFNWNTTGDYLIISKKSLSGISFDGMKGVKLSDAAIATLAITPSERSAIETMTRQLGDTRAAWAKEHVQRTEPSGDIVAQYSLPAYTDLAQSQLAIFTNGIVSALGAQRAQWLQDHSDRWMEDTGLRAGPDFSKVPPELLANLPPDAVQPKPTTLKLIRYQSGDDWYINCQLEQAGGNMTCGISPWQPFPEAFKSLFPGGWKELAEREGFELPKNFKKN